MELKKDFEGGGPLSLISKGTVKNCPKFDFKILGKNDLKIFLVLF